MYKKNVWLEQSQSKEEIFKYAEGYKDFLTRSKTERLFVKNSVALLEQNGFKEFKGQKLNPGDRVYLVNRKKCLAAFVIGSNPIQDGMLILGAHIDSPRLDIKQNPLYEKDEFALLDTHYYGGIKKYQWTARALAIHGVCCLKDGSEVDIHIGDEENDPVLGVGDLLIHLAKDQMGKTLGQAIVGENLDLTVGNIPLNKDEKDAVKKNVLNILKDKYHIEEEDLLSAELEVVPAMKTRDYGLDRSMIAGYGHDDKVCSYTSLTALIDAKAQKKTLCCILTDKEEVGSIGATGAQSVFFENAVAQLIKAQGESDAMYLTRICFNNSKMLSSDVSAGFDPLYPEVNDPKNTCHLSYGIVFNKYTGSGGKSGSNDASAEFIAEVRKAMDDNNICYQTAELGKVDAGGGGTIAYILGNYNMDVIDAGVGVLNMHAPMEIVSKADVYEAYLAYLAFLKI